MLLIGNKSDFINPKNSMILKLENNNILIFGANESGKTTLFNKINTNSTKYSYKNFEKYIIYVSDFKVGFINQKGHISNKNRISGTSFSKSTMFEITKMYYKTYKKEFKKYNKNVDYNLINYQLSEKWIDNKFLEQKSFFSFFEHTYSDFKNQILKIKKQISKSDKKEIKDLARVIFFGLKVIKQTGLIKNKHFLSFLKQMSHMDVDKKQKLHVIYQKEGINIALDHLDAIYKNSYYKTIKLLNQEDNILHKNKKNKIKISELLEKNKKSSKSFGAKRINNIIASILELIKDNKFTLIIDDPFDGLSQDNKMYLVNLFVELIKNNLKLVIFTNDIFSFQCLRNNIHNKINNKTNRKISTGIIKNDGVKVMIDDITDIDNILFKWNDKKYYEDIKKFVKKIDVNYEIANFLLSIHSEIIQDFLYLSELFIDHKKREPEIKKLYDLVINFSKNPNHNNKIINPKIKKHLSSKWDSDLNFFSSNRLFIKLLLLLSNQTSDLFYIFNKFHFLIYALKSILLITIYDYISEDLNESFGDKGRFKFKKEGKNEYQKRIAYIKKILDENKDWRNIFKHKNKFPLINALHHPKISKELWILFNHYFKYSSIFPIVMEKDFFIKFEKEMNAI